MTREKILVYFILVLLLGKEKAEEGKKWNDRTEQLENQAYVRGERLCVIDDGSTCSSFLGNVWG